MYADLAAFAAPPAPFSRVTTRALWTDPHISAQMLGFHLDQSNDHASRRGSSIDAFVAWLAHRVPMEGRRILDLGCGPGLYARRLAQRGATVTGLDFSERSIAYATSQTADLPLDYRVADYLVDPLPAGVDLVLLIYGDYCALSPADRRHLLARIRAALAPGGVLVFDVFSPGQLAAIKPGLDFGRRYMNGFWAAGDYFAFEAKHLYVAEQVSLVHYLVLAPERRFEIFNWMQYFTPSSIAAELAEAGFSTEGPIDLLTGETWQSSATAFAVLARPGDVA